MDTDGLVHLQSLPTIEKRLGNKYSTHTDHRDVGRLVYMCWNCFIGRWESDTVTTHFVCYVLTKYNYLLRAVLDPGTSKVTLLII